MISTFNAKKASLATNVAVVKRMFQDALETLIRLVLETTTFAYNPLAINWCFWVSIRALLRPIPCANALEIATMIMIAPADFSASNEMVLRLFPVVLEPAKINLTIAIILEVVSNAWHSSEIKITTIMNWDSAKETVISIATARLDLFVMSEKAVIMVAFQRVLATPTPLASEMMIFASHGQDPTRLSVFSRTKLAAMPLVEAFFQFHAVLEIAILILIVYPVLLASNVQDSVRFRGAQEPEKRTSIIVSKFASPRSSRRFFNVEATCYHDNVFIL